MAINLNKSLEFFDPMKLDKAIHIIGCGAIGSNLADFFARLGLEDIHLYDFDEVNAHNIANQRYIDSDVGSPKVAMLAKHMIEINPSLEATLSLHVKGYTGNEPLNGYVFLCVDNIDLRRQIVEQHRYNKSIKAMFDFRMRLADAQHYAADWNIDKHIENMLGTMQFTHEEAKDATPVSACGTTLSVMPTVSIICSVGVANFINFVKTGTIMKTIIIDAFEFGILAM